MKLALGTAQFGMSYGISNTQGQVNIENVQTILKQAKNSLLNTLDTAALYGNSEERLGQIGVDGFNIITKLPPVPKDVLNVTDWLRIELLSSLGKLKQKSVYGVLLHRPEQLFLSQGSEIVKALQLFKAEGLVRKVGVSVYEPNSLSDITQILPLDLVQCPLNVVDRRLVHSGWLQKLNDLGVEVHTRSAFLQGLLLMPRQTIPAKFERWSEIWNAWQTYLQQTGLSATQACLQYPLSLDGVAKVVVGVDGLSQFSELLRIAQNLKPSEVQIPSAIATNDADLINPSMWNQN